MSSLGFSSLRACRATAVIGFFQFSLSLGHQNRFPASDLGNMSYRQKLAWAVVSAESAYNIVPESARKASIFPEFPIPGN